MHTHTPHIPSHTHTCMHGHTHEHTSSQTCGYTKTLQIHTGYIAEGPETPNEHKALHTVYLMPTVQRKGKIIWSLQTYAC